MNNETSEALYFRYCRNWEGDLEPIRHSSPKRKNGAARFDPHPMSPGSEAAWDRSNWSELLEEVSTNLTPIERRTWMRLLDVPVSARSCRRRRCHEGCGYERIRGNSNGQGGMIRKTIMSRSGGGVAITY